MSINDLPPEILSEICHLASSRRPSNTYALRSWQKHRGHAYTYIMSRRKAPLNFIHVCRYWRSIGISTKSFWSTLSGNDPTPEATEHWLAFSQPAKLHLELSTPSARCFEGTRKAEMDVARRRTMQLFALHWERWTSLAFGICAALCQDLATMLHDVADADSKNKCTLETIEIELKDEDTSKAAINSLLAAINKFKTLRHVFWIAPSVKYTMPKVFPWSTLSKVYIHASFSINESVSALMQCTSATEVTLLGTHYSGLKPYTSESTDPCTLPKLASLVLNHRPFDLLKHFMLPSLTSLEVDSIKRGQYDHAEAQLESLLDRSKCTLHQFTVRDRYHSMSSDEIINCLLIPCLQSVPVVRVNSPGWRQRIEKKILGRSDMRALVPRIIHWDGYLGWSEDRPEDAVSLGQDSEEEDEM